MRVTKTRTIPAKPAVPERTAEYTIHVCDVCQKDNAVNSCAVCARDVCGPCYQFSPEDPSDHPAKWCLECYGLWHGKYHLVGEAIEEEYDKAVEKMRADWKAESLRKDAKAKGANVNHD